MKEIFLLKLGEIVLKGANKRQFENKLRQNVRRRMKKYGNFDVYILQSTVYVEPMDEEADVDGAWEACRSIFGVVSLCRCRPCEKDLDAIFAAIENYLGDDLDCAQSFKVESKRSDKRFPLNSIQISQEIGGRLAEEFPHVAVDVHTPDYTLTIDLPAMGSCLLRLTPEAPNPDAARISANKAMAQKRRSARSTKAASNSSK